MSITDAKIMNILVSVIISLGGSSNNINGKDQDYFRIKKIPSPFGERFEVGV